MAAGQCKSSVSWHHEKVFGCRSMVLRSACCSGAGLCHGSRGWGCTMALRSCWLQHHFPWGSYFLLSHCNSKVRSQWTDVSKEWGPMASDSQESTFFYCTEATMRKPGHQGLFWVFKIASVGADQWWGRFFFQMLRFPLQTARNIIQLKIQNSQLEAGCS